MASNLWFDDLLTIEVQEIIAKLFMCLLGLAFIVLLLLSCYGKSLTVVEEVEAKRKRKKEKLEMKSCKICINSWNEELERMESCQSRSRIKGLKSDLILPTHEKSIQGKE